MGKKTSSSRFLTTVLQGILGDEIVKQISWKGQKRGGIQKIGFESQPICKVLMKSAKLLWKGGKTEDFQKTISGWLAQRLTKIIKSTGLR
ncbi:hypothetical protein LSTR_LSTR017675 [Laodelphax striatellus]|uniref:DUF4806 domain-containing protein n=1 Tax=Laodelphax striatellus TaxID=195883 RepID=A0A482WNL7_LAOST|nr:hypothetical protein LSTR_LSTR017675 [Laodelphax striatellus]